MLKSIISLSLLSYSSLVAAVIYSEDFSSVTLPVDNTQGRLGFFNGNVNFDEISVAANSNINNGVLNITNSSNSFRGIGIAIDPLTFQGAGTYELDFDITSFTAASTQTAEVSIWSGNGYQFGNDANNLILNAESGALTAGGTAVASNLTTETYTSSGTQNISFAYGGESAIVLYFGITESVSFPFPEVGFDNITVSTVPEPSSLLLTTCASIFLFRREGVENKKGTHFHNKRSYLTPISPPSI